MPGRDPLPPFWKLVEQHGGELLRHARRLSGDAAEDVLQEALLRALRSYARLQNANHLRAWLYRVTTTTAYDHHSGRPREVPMEDVPDAVHNDGYADGGFEALLEGLSDGPRRALEMRFVHDLDYEDMAERMGCSVEAARQRVSSAVRTLRGRMT